MAGFDPANPPPWVKRLIERVATRTGESFHVETRKSDGAGGANVMALGVGTFVAPLPEAWSLHPERPYQGRIRVKEGYDIHYRVDSYEDVEAAEGGPRLLCYADEPEFQEDVKSPEDVGRKILISIPGRDPIGKEILWKWVDPCFGTHVRELVLRCPLVNEELVEHRMSIAKAVAEWLQLGGFAPAPTPLDGVAHTAALERVSFEDTVLMRVPRAWKVEDASDPGDERKLYAVDEPQDRETLWVTSQFISVPEYDDIRIPLAFMGSVVDSLWQKMDDEPQRWIMRRRETLDDGDILIVRTSEEVEKGEKLRRITWIRYAIRDDAMIWAPIHLVTAEKYLDDPAQIEMEALVDREVRHAILVRPPRSKEA